MEAILEKVDVRCLNSIGFFEKNDPFLGNVWCWGTYTASNVFEHKKYTSPILSWDPSTQMMYAHPLDYRKKITTLDGFNKMIESVNFLISTES